VLENTGERLLPWDLQYPQNHYEHLQRYYFAQQFAAGRKVLDLGSGEGYGTDIMAMVAEEAIGVDISSEAVEWASQKYKRSNVKYICSSAATIPISGEQIFDLVVCFEMIEHIADQQALFGEIKRLLKNNGLLIVSTPNKATYSDDPHYRNPFHVSELYVSEFKELVESFFPHAAYMGQRVHPTAAMWPLEGNSAKANEIIVERSNEGLVRVEPTRRSPMYVIALASKRPFPIEVQNIRLSHFFLTDLSDTLVKSLCQDYDARLEAVQTKYSQSQNEVQNAQRHVARLGEELAGRDARIARLDAVLSEQQAQLGEQQTKIINLSGQIAGLKHLESLHNSRLWKLASWPLKLNRNGRLLISSLRMLPPILFRQSPLKPLVKLRSARELARSGLLDRTFYLENYADVRAARIEPLVHYLLAGSQEGRDPHPLFSTSFYLASNPDVARAGVNPLLHFVNCGWTEGRDPHPLFSTSFYLASNPDVARAGVDPLLHFVNCGWTEGRDPHPLFSTSFYLARNRDVACAGVNPLLHYLAHGAYEGRNPHPHFDSSYYLNQNEDVAQARLNPLAHYVKVGIAEGRDPNPYFDTSWYLEEHPQVALKGLNPLVHWIDQGADPGSGRSAPSSAKPQKREDFELRAVLRHEFQLSGRPLLDSDHDSAPLVSIIIPCFTQRSFLEDALLSSLLACSQPMEIIVVDDGSPELDSAALVDELKKQYRFTFIHQRNASPANARNVGIEYAKGEFVQFLDPADLLASGKIDFQINEFRLNPKVDVCVSEYDLSSADGLERRAVKPSTIEDRAFAKEEFTSRWNKGFFIPIHCALFRRTLLEKLGSDFAGAEGQDDQSFWIKLLSLSPQFRFNDTVLATVRNLRSTAPAGSRVLTRTAARHSTGRSMVSVVVPCYNQGQYLDEAVESVLTQSFQDFEIIIVFDGSTDPETIEILDSYDRPKTSLIRSVNQGLAGARNRGVSESTGKYILPLDADDKIGGSYLEKAVSILEANDRVGIVYCKAELFGDASGPWNLPPYRFPDILLGNQIFCSAFFRRTDWVKVNGYNPFGGWEDFDFWLSLIELGCEVLCLPDTLFFYRKRAGSMIARMSRELQVRGFAQLFRNHPKLYMDNIAMLVHERPHLWSEFENFIQGVESLRDERLRLAWTVIRHLINNIESSAQQPKIEHEIRL